MKYCFEIYKLQYAITVCNTNCSMWLQYAMQITVCNYMYAITCIAGRTERINPSIDFLS